MVDRLTEAQRSYNMARVRGRDTKPEMMVRQTLHALGFRYRLHRRDLPGSPDLVMPKWKTVLFVNGCFWHGHRCDLFRWPATRVEFWKGKIERNVQRDHDAIERLLADGWRVVVVWECTLKGKAKIQSANLASKLATAVRSSDSVVEIAGQRHSV